MKLDFALVGALLAGAIAGAGAARAAEPVTPKEAEAMVKRGVAFIKANGREKAYAEITSPQGQFRDRDLYLVVYRARVKCAFPGSTTTQLTTLSPARKLTWANLRKMH